MGFGDYVSGLLSLGDSIYKYATSERDFDYQKALQQQIFAREDTAVQRRMEDLKAAGLNPNLAAGSAASAGSVVGRSETPGINLGGTLDAIQASNQIKLLKQEQAMKNFEYQKSVEDMKYQRLQDLYMLGFNPDIAFGNDGKLHIKALHQVNNFSNTPLGQILDYQVTNQKNSADILQKQNNWFTTNQILSAANSVIGDIGTVGGLFRPKFYKGRYQR